MRLMVSVGVLMRPIWQKQPGWGLGSGPPGRGIGSGPCGGGQWGWSSAAAMGSGHAAEPGCRCQWGGRLMRRAAAAAASACAVKPDRQRWRHHGEPGGASGAAAAAAARSVRHGRDADVGQGGGQGGGSFLRAGGGAVLGARPHALQPRAEREPHACEGAHGGEPDLAGREGGAFSGVARAERASGLVRALPTRRADSRGVAHDSGAEETEYLHGRGGGGMGIER